MNHSVLLPEVREYLLKHIHANPADFLLMSHPFKIDAKELAQQLVGLQKARFKFPELFSNEQVIFPPKVNLEQTSSFSTSAYKATLVSGKTMVDLTGGWGVDVLAFAKAGFSTTHLERNPELQAYSEQLFKALDLNVQSLCTDGINYAYQELDFVNVIYIDPGRKTSASPKAIRLEDYEPDVLQHLDLLLQKCDVLMIKTSPMLDLNRGMEQLKYVFEIQIVAFKNEVKELLWLLKKRPEQTEVVCVNLKSKQQFLRFNTEKDQNCDSFSAPKKYLYEPNASIMKSQGFKSLAESYNLEKLDINAHLFTSDSLMDFPGRVFEIQEFSAYKPKSVKKKYGKTARGIVTRNFKNTVKQLRDKFQFTENEMDYLFFTSVKGVGAVVIEAVKL